MPDCPECRSVLYSRTPQGWRCSSCTYLEPLNDSDVLVNAKPGQAHGNVWGEQRNPGWNRDHYLTPESAPKKGSFRRFREIRERNAPAALRYLLEHHFTSKDDLNRHYLVAEVCLELGKLNQAKIHIAVCTEKVAQAAKPQAIKQLEEQINSARQARFEDHSRRSKTR